MGTFLDDREDVSMEGSESKANKEQNWESSASNASSSFSSTFALH